MNQPKSERGRKFLLALRELMIEHDVSAINGWDTGECWVNFGDEEPSNHSEPDMFTLDLEEMRSLE